MSKTQQWLMGTVVVLLVIVGFVANGLFLSTNAQLKQAQAQIAALKADSGSSATTTEPVTDDSASEKSLLARVANLLPDGANVVHTLTLPNDLTVVGTVPSFDGGSEQQAMTVSVADAANNKLTELAHHDTTGPGITTSFEQRDYPLLAIVRVLEQWEGDDLRITDYINASGSLLMTQTYRAGQIIELNRKGKTMTLQLAPKDACKDSITDAKRVNVTGLLVNGTEVKFKKSYSVTCNGSELMGMGYYPNMGEVSFDGQATADGHYMATLALPVGNLYASIDVDKQSTDGVTISE